MAAAEGGGAGGGRREPPHTLQGLLEMAVVAGEAQPEPREPMGEERQQWLRAAVAQALSGRAAPAELRRCLALLARPCPGEEAAERGRGDTESHERALAQLAELCESLDNATDFCSLGGLEAALPLLGHPWAPLRAGAARLLGACAQNLPGAQSRALALGALPALLGGLRADPDPQVPPAALFAISWVWVFRGRCWGGSARTPTPRCRPPPSSPSPGALLGGLRADPDPQVPPAALFAISCLVRAQPQGLEQLEALGGLEVLAGTLQSPQPPLRARAAFLLHCLLREHPRLKEPLLQLGLVPRLAELLRSEHDAAHEHGLGTLCSLAWGCAEGLRQCRAPALGLEPLLRQRRQLLRGHDQFQEELEFCERLLQICFETPPEESTMDR